MKKTFPGAAYFIKQIQIKKLLDYKRTRKDPKIRKLIDKEITEIKKHYEKRL